MRCERSVEMKKYYTIKEVAELFNVTIQTVHAYTKNGELKTVRFGNSVRIAESDLKEFIKKGRKE